MTEARAPTLVIGVGSPLRRDDAAGRVVVERLAGRGLQGVEIRSVHQLTPELGDDAAGRRTVVFVDATVVGDRVDVVPVTPATAEPGRAALTHHVDPRAVLALAGALGTAPRAAWLVSVPARDLSVGTGLSPTTEAGVAEAVGRVVALVA